MYLAYLDESGDSGVGKSPTQYFVLSCVLVHESKWLESLDLLIELRRELLRDHQIPTRPELKSRHFNNGQGPLKHLRWSRSDRMNLFRDILRRIGAEFPVKVFSVAIDKAPARNRGWGARMAAWTFTLQRIERFSVEHEGDWAMIFPDEGHGHFIRKRLRHMRRYHSVPKFFGGGTLEVPTRRIIEDPNERASQDSYFIQMADWAAYAAHRSSHVAPIPGVPDDLWDQLDEALLLQVNKLAGGPPGLVLYSP
jgi:hypothetical protein